MDGSGYRSRCDADKMLLSEALLRYVEEASPQQSAAIAMMVKTRL